MVAQVRNILANRIILLSRDKKLFLSLMVCVFLTGCFKPSETIIANTPFIVDKQGVEFHLEKPIKRKNKSGSIKIELGQVGKDWDTLPPYTSIRLYDSSRVASSIMHHEGEPDIKFYKNGGDHVARVKVILFSEDGRIFIANILGSADSDLDARFEPEIPKNAEIAKVKIVSNIPFKCNRVMWHQFYPL
ncbi:MAG: hypothetical protein WA666_09555 [Nitrospirota bacterium]